MRAVLIFTLATVMMSQAMAQEDVPLELGRPSATPIKIQRTPPPPPPSLDPPPTEAVKPRKIKKTAKLKTAPPKAAVIETAPPLTPSPLETVAPAAPLAKPHRKKTAMAGESVVKTDAVDRGVRKRALLNFRFANIWAIRNRTNTGSFILSWDPVLYPWKRFNFGASLGVTQFESENVAGRSAESFVVYEYGLSASYYLSRTFLPELLIGGQMWNEAGGSSNNLLIALNGNILFKRRPFGYLDRFYVGLGSLQMTGGSTNIFRAGIGVRF